MESISSASHSSEQVNPDQAPGAASWNIQPEDSACRAAAAQVRASVEARLRASSERAAAAKLAREDRQRAAATASAADKAVVGPARRAAAQRASHPKLNPVHAPSNPKGSFKPSVSHPKLQPTVTTGRRVSSHIEPSAPAKRGSLKSSQRPLLKRQPYAQEHRELLSTVDVTNRQTHVEQKDEQAHLSDLDTARRQQAERIQRHALLKASGRSHSPTQLCESLRILSTCQLLFSAQAGCFLNPSPCLV